MLHPSSTSPPPLFTAPPRFANRIPLLFEAGNDVITKTAAKRVNWATYKINQHTDKVGVFVSIVSTKIPFKGAGKEYIGDDVEEMVSAVKAALMACGLQLKSKIARQLAAREHQQRKRNLTKYIPNTAAAVFAVLESMAASQPRGPKRRRMQEKDDVLERVRRGEVTQVLLSARLAEHVERIDTDMALEYQVQQGLAAGAAKEEVFLAPAAAAGPGRSQQQQCLGPELHAAACVLRLMEGSGCGYE